MQDTCHYCKKQAIVEDFQNPYTKQIHLTCEQCKGQLSLYFGQRMFYTKLLIVGPLVSIGISIISFLFLDWKIGILFIAVASVIGLVSFKLQAKYVKLWQQETGTYVDRTQIRWCKTCIYLKKIGTYESTLWQSREMIDDFSIPCKIAKEVTNTWAVYFEMDPMHRTLYPKDCTKWQLK